MLIELIESTSPECLASLDLWRLGLFGALRKRLAVGQSPAVFEELILTLLRTPEALWSLVYRDTAQRNREQSLTVLGAIDASLTTAQRAHLQRELLQLADQLEGMIER